jgi:hypothetical protein
MNQYNQTDHYILGIPTLNPEAALYHLYGKLVLGPRSEDLALIYNRSRVK